MQCIIHNTQIPTHNITTTHTGNNKNTLVYIIMYRQWELGYIYQELIIMKGGSVHRPGDEAACTGPETRR